MFENEDEETENKTSQVKQRQEIAPKGTSTYIRDLAKRPLFCRSVLYLHEHGITYQQEIWEDLGCNQASAYGMMKRLTDVGIVKTLRGADREVPVLDRRMTYYTLTNVVKQNSHFIPELKKWFEYEQLGAIEKLFSPYEWISVEGLKANEGFASTIDKWGLTFEDALRLITASGVFYVERDRNDEVERFKRAFNNYHKRVPKEQTEPPKPKPSKYPSRHPPKPEEETVQDVSELIVVVEE